MTKLLSLFSVLFLYGCTYTDVYVHEETEIFKNSLGNKEHVVNLLADVELMLYPDFRYFRPGYDNKFVLLNVISNDPGSIHIANVKFVNMDSGLLYENIMNETVTLKYSESFRGIPNLELYGGGIRLSVEEIYPKVYGASEIEMTVSFSMNGRLNESKTFKLKRVTDVFFILGAA